MTMNKEKQRIAIAEACGKLHCPDCPDQGWYAVGDPYGPEQCQCEFCYSVEDSIFNAPDYLNDLNAMHEAEKTLELQKLRSYAFMLTNRVLNLAPTVDLMDMFLSIHATAAQRAEAFLKTIGKWEDENPKPSNAGE